MDVSALFTIVKLVTPFAKQAFGRQHN